MLAASTRVLAIRFVCNSDRGQGSPSTPDQHPRESVLNRPETRNGMGLYSVSESIFVAYCCRECESVITVVGPYRAGFCLSAGGLPQTGLSALVPKRLLQARCEPSALGEVTRFETTFC